MDDNNNSNISWYAPLNQEVSAVPASKKAEVKPDKAKKTGGVWLVLLAVLAVVCLVAATVMLYSKFTFNKSGSGIQIIYGSEDSDQGFTINPGSGFDSFFSDDDSDSSDGSMPDSKEDFFASYYTSSDAVEANIILERTEVPIDFEMALSEPSEEELSLQELY